MHSRRCCRQVAGSGWLEHVALVLGSSMRIAKALHETGVPALVHCRCVFGVRVCPLCTVELVLGSVILVRKKRERLRPWV